MLVIFVVVICASSCTTTTSSPPVFFNAQNKGFRDKRPPQPKGKKAPALAPAPIDKDIGPKCEAGDRNCVYAGLPPPESQCNGNACNKRVQIIRNGQRCSYPEKNCVKGKAPEDGSNCGPSDECVFSQTDVCQAKSCTAAKGQPCKYGDRHCVKAEPPQQSPSTALMFPGCENTTNSLTCNTHDPCVHYTCNTLENANRIDEESVNTMLKCARDKILKCFTFDGNIRYCTCVPMPTGDYDGKKCPDGFVVKKYPILSGGLKPLPAGTRDYCVLPS